MPFFGTSSSTTRGRRSWFHRTSRDRRAGGLKAALANPNTTHHGRKNAKTELHAMGRSSHVPFMTKVKRTLGIRSSPRRRTTFSRGKRSRF
ncbi:hypothetical protein DFH08DRAFT_946882 [Mycena albidolilacea]|uniref:Uncharacterized protein n=1 Tax=Mycena albidolilacea TaxID=1033008 RepID=A0AAD7ATV9_9AGAR|nr:hypothetical protein DFH08DRAFT_946882 [Mycena albidolilacea]